jgi:hypothetical protein
VEADPGLGGQTDDPLGLHYRWELAKQFGRRRAATTGTPSVTTVPERIGAPCTAERECRCWAIMSAAELEPSVEVIHPLQVMLLTVDLAITQHGVVGPRLGHVGAVKEEDRQWRATRRLPSMG